MNLLQFPPCFRNKIVNAFKKTSFFLKKILDKKKNIIYNNERYRDLETYRTGAHFCRFSFWCALFLCLLACFCLKNIKYKGEKRCLT